MVKAIHYIGGVLLLCCFQGCVQQEVDLDAWRPLSTTQCDTVQASSTELGSCPCDLTASNCDPNCCCDPNCTPAFRSTFTDCTVVPHPSHRACVYDEIIIRDNSPFAVERTDDNLFCILHDNNEERHTFVPQCSVITSREFEDLLSRTQLLYSFSGDSSEVANNGFVSNADCSGACLTASRYSVGSGVVVAQTLSAGDQRVFGFLSIARGILSGQCSDTNQVGYFQDEVNTCTRQLGTSSSSSPSSLSSSCSHFEVDGLSVRFYHVFNTSVLLALPAGDLLLSEIPESEFLSINCTFNDEGGTTGNCTDVLDIEADGSSCRNIVSKVSIIVTIDGFTIISVDMDLGIISIDSSDVSQSLVQTHRIQFVNVNAASANAEVNTYPFSGKPGYLRGKPVLAGNLLAASDSEVFIDIDQDPTQWLYFPKGGVSQTCPSLDDIASDGSVRQLIKFPFDALATCTFVLSGANFTDCASMRAVIEEYVASMTARITLLGRYGNASQVGAGDWIEVLNRVPPETVDFGGDSAPGSECSGIITGVHLTIITASIGAVVNPQATIIGARYTYTFSTIQRICPGQCNDSDEQSMMLHFSTSFVDVSEKPKEALYEKPDIVHNLPDDFWHPF